MTYSGSGDVTAAVTVVPVAMPTPGCEATDFAGFPAGNIALISRGACTFAIKATNASNAGAVGVVIYNNIAGPDQRDPWQRVHPRLPGHLGHPGGWAAVGGNSRSGAASGDIDLPGQAPRPTSSQRRPGRTRTTWSWPEGISTRSTPGPGSTTTGRGRQPCSRSPSKWPRSSRRTPSLRLVGGGGGEPGRLHLLRHQPESGGAGQDRALSELRHGGLAQPCVLHLRRGQFRRRRCRTGPARVGPDREEVRGVLQLPRHPVQGNRLQWSVRLRAFIAQESTSPPAGCSPGPKGSRPPKRPPSGAAPPASSTTPATTRHATRSTTSTCSLWTPTPTPSPTSP